MPPQSIDREYPSTGSGKPRMYTIVGSEIYFRPAPDSGYTAEILYLSGIIANNSSMLFKSIAWSISFISFLLIGEYVIYENRFVYFRNKSNLLLCKK